MDELAELLATSGNVIHDMGQAAEVVAKSGMDNNSLAALANAATIAAYLCGGIALLAANLAAAVTQAESEAQAQSEAQAARN